MTIDVEGIKAGQRMMWSTGDYPTIAEHISEAADVLVQLADVRAGQRVLDVATGSGNVAIVAARRGANVTGLDLTPELLEVARSRAAGEGLEIELIEGDAEALPFPDAAYDRVTSCFGVMFAPRQRVAAQELLRVVRPGGSVAVAAWTPEGLNGKMFQTVASHLPPPPAELTSPVMWGDEEHVRGLLADTSAELEFARRTVTFQHESPESWLDFNVRVLGPTILAKAALEPQGRWSALEADLLALYRDSNEADDGTLRVQAEYLITLAHIPA
jgi:ubiquinone/menaquinone biosynthesis C-methylase UbiE